MKIICVGRNYATHIAELQNERPASPVLFLKPDSAIILKNQPFFIPDFSQNIHFEVELLVKINRIGKHIQEKFAHKYYDEIGLGIDFTARDLQNQLKEKGLPWEKAKAFDGSALVGSWASKKDFPDIENINFSMTKNEKTVQQGNTAHMLWKVNALIAHISQFFTLKIGDIIFTGTPAGVGQVVANDHLAGYIEQQKFFEITVK